MPSVDPAPYSQSLTRLIVRTTEGPARIEVDAGALRITGSAENLRRFSSYLHVRAGSHVHFEGHVGHPFIAEDSLPLVIECEPDRSSASAPESDVVVQATSSEVGRALVLRTPGRYSMHLGVAILEWMTSSLGFATTDESWKSRGHGRLVEDGIEASGAGVRIGVTCSYEDVVVSRLAGSRSTFVEICDQIERDFVGSSRVGGS